MSEQLRIDGPNVGDINWELVKQDPKRYEWSLPTEFDLSQESERANLNSLIESGEISDVLDKVNIIAKDIFALKYPERKNDNLFQEAFTEEFLSRGLSYGKWFYFPWSKALVRYPEKQDHRALRTSRNRNLITESEQKILYNSTVAVFGLSVGSNVADRLVASGIGGKFVLADMDVLEPSNLNRINANFSDVGSKKIDIIAKRISEIDPFIQQVHLPLGVTKYNLESLGPNDRPDLIIEEVDDLSMKAAIRLFAEKEGIPLVMATDVGDKTIIDVERYDLGGVTPFNGRLNSHEVHVLAEGLLSVQERTKFMLKIIGLKNITTRIIESAMQIDKTLSGLPQLGVTASIGGNFATISAREILLGRKLSSGRYVCSPKNILELSSPTNFPTGMRTLVQFARSRHNR